MKTRTRRWCDRALATVVIALLATAAWGQIATGTLSGTVHDETGATLPGVVVTVKSSATGATRSATTDMQGRYRVPALNPGDVKDINTVWGSVDYPNVPPPASLGFGTPRDVFNPRHAQFAARLKF